MTKKSLGSAPQNRDGRVSGNTPFFFFGLTVIIVQIQIGNRCGLRGILCYIDHKTASLSNR